MVGVVKSNKMKKALGVVVITTKVSSKYGKRFKSKKTYTASCDDSSKYLIGQKVNLISTPPKSKTIRWKVIN